METEERDPLFNRLWPIWALLRLWIVNESSVFWWDDPTVDLLLLLSYLSSLKSLTKIYPQSPSTEVLSVLLGGRISLRQLLFWLAARTRIRFWRCTGFIGVFVWHIGGFYQLNFFLIRFKRLISDFYSVDWVDSSCKTPVESLFLMGVAVSSQLYGVFSPKYYLNF